MQAMSIFGRIVWIRLGLRLIMLPLIYVGYYSEL